MYDAYALFKTSRWVFGIGELDKIDEIRDIECSKLALWDCEG